MIFFLHFSAGWARAKRNIGQYIIQQPSAEKKSFAEMPSLVEIYQEYDIDKMEDRAEKFSDVDTLKRRARRYVGISSLLSGHISGLGGFQGILLFELASLNTGITRSP